MAMNLYQLPAVFTLCILSSFAVHSQPRNLVFEGAGIRGIAYCGVLAELEQKGWLQQVQRAGGTSAGAITAMAVALGYSSAEIKDIIISTPFKKFNEGAFFFPGGIHRLKNYFGWYKTKRMEDWLGKIIAAKTGNAAITFRQLHDQDRFKDLFVTGTCLNQQRLIIFSHETYPDMKIRDAVRISMSVPLYFEAVFIDRTGKVYPHPKNKNALDVLVDGGFTGNFPIRIFDSTRYRPDTNNAIPVNRFAINHETIGCRIDTDDQIELDNSRQGKLADLPVQNLKQYFAAFYNIVLENLNRQPLTAEDWQRTVSISDGGIGPRIRKMKKEEIEKLMHNGSKGFLTFIQSKQ